MPRRTMRKKSFSERTSRLRCSGSVLTSPVTDYILAHRGQKYGCALDVDLKRRDKRFLRNIDFSELPHAFLAFLLLLQQLAFARGVTAVAFRGDVLAKGAHGFAGNDLAADCRLDRHLEHVWRDQFLELFRHGTTT